MMSRFAYSTFLLPLLLPIACGGDDTPTDDEVGETGTADTSSDTQSEATESSDTVDTSTDTTDDTSTDTTDDTDTTTDDTDTTDTTESTDGAPVDADMDGSPADEDCDDADPNNFPGNAEVCDQQDNNCDDVVDLDAVDADTYYQDTDMDGYGLDGTEFTSCEVPPGTAMVGGDCNDEDPEAHPDANDVCAFGPTCLAIFESGAGDQDGVYLVDPAGVDVGGAPVDVWCDMTNGGLTAALVINSINEGTYIGDFGSDYVATDLLAADPAQASGQGAQAVQAWLDLNEYDYVDFRLAAYSDESNTFTSGWIARTSLRIEFGQPGYLLYAEPNNLYSWCGGPASYTDGGVGQINKPAGAPDDCKGHASLGSGWDFSLFGNAGQFNQGLTLCGSDGSGWMLRNFGNSILYYPTPGAAYVVWTR